MKEKRSYILLSIVLIIIMFFAYSGTVKAQEKRIGQESSSYFLEAERQYRKELKELLTEEGFYNAGITMTKTISEKEVLYMVCINHKKATKLSENQMKEVNQKIDQISFLEKDVILSTKFL